MTEKEILYRLKNVEKWQKIKRKNNKIAYYNTGEKSIKSKWNFICAVSETAGFLEETAAGKQSAVR